MPRRFVLNVVSGLAVVSFCLVITAFGQSQEPQQPPQPSQPAQPSPPVQQPQPAQQAQPSAAQIYQPLQLPPKQPGVVRIGVIRPLSLIGPEATFDTSAETRDL